MVGVWLLAALCATVRTELDSKLDEQWELWKKIHEKMYQNEVEELGRRALWEKKLKQVNIHNFRASLGLHTYTMGINQLSDLTEGEISQLNAPLILPEDFKMTPTPLNVTNAALPESVDWRRKGYVTRVRDQTYHCQSCWAFSAAGALEGLWVKKTGKLVELSPQNLMDCSRPYGDGCKPGRMDHAFEYVITNKGIESEHTYPYEAQINTCRYTFGLEAATCSSYSFVPEDELSLKKAVATIGPISVAISEDDILHYSSGVYYNQWCSKNINHAVLVVGYGRDSVTGLDYWLIKNSRGPGWGENGYIRLARNENQMCGISLHSLYPR